MKSKLMWGRVNEACQTASYKMGPESHTNVLNSTTCSNLKNICVRQVLAGLQVPFLCTETHELGEELVASYLYQVHLYHWLETTDYGRFLSDQDL